jgi:acetyl esterase/lipase
MTDGHELPAAGSDAPNDPGSALASKDAEAPAASGRRRWFRARLGPLVGRVLLVGWAALIVGLCVVPVLPKLPEWGFALSLLETSFSLYMLIPALIGFVVAIVIWRTGRRWLTVTVAAVAVLAVAAAVVPWMAASGTASANGVPLSLRTYFSSSSSVSGPASAEVYAQVDGERLRLDVWQPGTPARGGPAVVWVHGGGWTSGHRSQNPTMDQWYTDHGYTVFDIDYRLSPPPRWQEEVGDVKCAIGWVARNADRYRIDPDNITVAGGSAGANLAMLAAYTVGTGVYPPSCDVPEHQVRSVISLFGPTDTAVRDTGTPSVSSGRQRDYFGGDPTAVPDAYRTTSPITYVRAGLPPTLQIQGTLDHIVPTSEIRRMDDLLATAGVAHRTVMLPWTEHAYDVFWSSWGTQISYGVIDQFLSAYAR